MGMTMTQKILAAHAGLDSVVAGQLIRANLDMVLGNDITSPVAINEFEKAGFSGVFDKSKVSMVMDHFTPNKDIKAAEQCKQCRTFARKFDLDNFYDVGNMGIEHALLPEKGLVAQVMGHLQIGFAVNALRRPVIFRHGLSDGFLIEGFQRLELFGKIGFRTDLGHIRMMVGVISDGVAFLDHSLHQLRTCFQIISHDKKGGRSVMLFQGVQNRRGAAAFKAAVEGQVNPFLFCFFYIISTLGKIHMLS